MKWFGVTLAALVLVAVGSPADAHGDEMVSMITAVTPAGFTATITDDGERMTVTNPTDKPLIIDGYFEEPSVRVDTAGVWRNTVASELSLDEDAVTGTMPNVAEATQRPHWVKVSDGSSFTWHDHRAHWMSSVMPAQVLQDPDHAHVIQVWTVPVTFDGRVGAIQGTLVYEGPGHHAAAMSDHGSMQMLGDGIGPLTSAAFFTTWSVQAGWLLAAILLVVGYQWCWTLARRRGHGLPLWRAVTFHAGIVLMWVSVASAIGAYSMSIFWMHMVLHLILIMAVPALLVLGHPLAALVGATGGAEGWAARALRTRLAGLIFNPFTGFVVYTVVIIYTHLTGFMDRMAMNMTLMAAEQVAYVVAGYLMFLPLIGEEPIRWRAPYLVRLVICFAAMVPDTLVGIVLLQSTSNPFPMMMSMHPAWAPNAVSDVHTAGALMWAVGDGLMMLIAVGLMISVVTSPTKRDHMTGAWLESVRAGAILHAGRNADAPVITDADSDEALDAYNAMLGRLSGHDDRP